MQRTPSFSRHVLSPVVLTVGCVLCTCSNDRAALIGDPATDSGTGSGAQREPAAPAWLPALPDQDARPICEACVKEHCIEARSNCLEDDACKALLQCKAECDNPACLYDCDAEHGRSSWNDDLWRCAFLDCKTECNVGHNWGCVEGYDWTASDEPVFEVTVRFREPAAWLFRGQEGGDDLFLIGAEVKSCPPYGSDCGNPDDTAVVDGSNAVTLEVQRFHNDLSYLTIESEVHGGFGQRELLSLPPVSRSGEIHMAYLPRATWAYFGWSQTAGSRAVAVYVSDCLLAPARGIRVELPAEPGAEVRHYSDTSLSADFTETQTGLAFVPAVNSELVRVEAFRTDTDALVAERSVVIWPGWVSHAILSPLPQ